MNPIKVCGIANLENLKLVLKYPISAIGFIFFEKSPRYISPDEAKKLIEFIPKNIKKVGVFVNEKVEIVQNLSEKLNLDFIQLHGNENQNYINQINIPIIKAFRINPSFNFEILKEYHVHSFLLDTFQPGIFGGTGESFNWHLLNKIESTTPIILSGGLNPNNIEEAIKIKNVNAWDINSGVEKCPGEKDETKLSKLFSKLKIKTEINIFNEI